MKIECILDYCLNSFEGAVLIDSWGEQGIFYNPDMILKRGVYIATIKSKDGENDKASNLNRENIFRINIGVGKPMFIDMFGTIPTRPAAGGIVSMLK